MRVRFSQLPGTHCKGVHALLLVLLLICSCAVYPDSMKSGTSKLIRDVPFYPQEAYECGPASLAGVLSYWHVGVSPNDIAAEIYSPSARGTLDTDMVFYAERKGLAVAQYRGCLEDLRRNVDLDHPLIVLVDDGFWIYQQNHFMVVVGWNAKGIIANSGKERLKSISYKDFLRAWKKTDFWTMRITPQPTYRPR